MNPRLLVPLAFAMGLIVCAMTGCTQSAAPQYQQPDPFGYPGMPGQCLPGQCQPGQCPPGCPPGCCPAPRHDAEVQGIEVGSGSPLHPVNAIAQSEVKSSGSTSATDPPAGEVKNGQCLPCQQQPIYRPMRQPTMHPHVPVPQPAAVPVSATEEVKQGRFQCDKCKRPTVGRDWQEIWSDDGTSILCLCKKCYAESTPQQREAVMRSYLARHGIDPAKRPYVEDAVRQAARGH